MYETDKSVIRMGTENNSGLPVCFGLHLAPATFYVFIHYFVQDVGQPHPVPELRGLQLDRPQFITGLTQTHGILLLSTHLEKGSLH